MKAVAYRGVGRVHVADVPDPRIEQPADAVVRVRVSAICGSDLHFYHGKAPLEEGETIGHEAMGVVESAGSEVKSVSPGDRVAIAFDIVCGNCWFCRRGETQLCEEFANLGAGVFGGGLGGTQAELVRIPFADTNLLPLPDDVTDEQAVFIGDTLTTGIYATGCAGIGAGDTVAVVGAGPVGFFCAQAARVRGAGRVVVLDRDPERLALARKAGAEAVNIDERNAQMALADRTGGRGADVVIEAVGTEHAFESATDIVRRGGRVVVAGMFTGETAEIPLGIFWVRALSLRFAGITPVHAWWHESLEALRKGRIDTDSLISHRLPLSEAVEGYRMFDAREATKVLLFP